jgi:predicted TIM-barrel fold metal-dependent hydrolase
MIGQTVRLERASSMRRVLSLLMLSALLTSANTACDRSSPPTEAESANVAYPPWRPHYVRPGVIDIHGHISPDGIGLLARSMNANGIEVMVNLSGDARPTGASPDSGPVPFFSLDWRRRNQPGFGQAMAEALDGAVRTRGFRGCKIPKVLGLYAKDAEGRRIPVDWVELDPVWEKAAELGVPVAIHTADPKAFWLPPTPDNERYDELALHPQWSFHGHQWPDRMALLDELERVFAKHPKTTFISVHFGNNAEELEYVDRILDTYPNVYIDTAARLGEIGRHPADKVRALFIEHADRILFGTDIGLSARGIMLGSTGREVPTEADIKPFYEAHWRFFEGDERGIPHPTPIQGRWTIDAINLPDDVLLKLYRDNARRVLKLP